MSRLTQPSGAGWRRISLFVLLAGSTLATSAFAVPGNYQIQQTRTSSQSYNSFSSNNNGSWTVTSTPSLSIDPFSSYSTGSGTLNSVTIEWTHVFSFSGTVASNVQNGSIGGTVGGSAYVDSISYSYEGGGSGNGGTTNAPVTFTTNFCGSNPCAYVFTAAAAGVSQNPGLWPILSGGSVFTVRSDLSGSVGWSGISSGLVAVDSSVTVTYDYFGEPVPSNAPIAPAASLLGLGLAMIGLSNAARRRGSRRQVSELS